MPWSLRDSALVLPRCYQCAYGALPLAVLATGNQRWSPGARFWVENLRGFDTWSGGGFPPVGWGGDCLGQPERNRGQTSGDRLRGCQTSGEEWGPSPWGAAGTGSSVTRAGSPGGGLTRGQAPERTSERTSERTQGRLTKAGSPGRPRQPDHQQPGGQHHHQPVSPQDHDQPESSIAAWRSTPAQPGAKLATRDEVLIIHFAVTLWKD
jgi:hypothetical protein